MITRGLISVVITNYNYARYVGLAIDSARRQTYDNIEIIVVDDGSTDSSKELLDACATEDNRIHLIFQENAGQAAATNRGILESRGEFVAFLDADDIWYPNKLTRQIGLFADDRVGVAYSGAKIIDLEGREYAVRETKAVDKGEDFLRHIMLENFIFFSSAVVRKECFVRAGLLNSQYRVCTDYDLWLRIGKFYKFDCIDECLIGYRARPDSLSGDPVEMLKTAREITDLFYQQNAKLFDARFMRMERALAHARRVYIFSKTGHIREALSSLWRLVAVSPFSTQFLKSAAHVCFVVSDRLIAKGCLRRS